MSQNSFSNNFGKQMSSWNEKKWSGDVPSDTLITNPELVMNMSLTDIQNKDMSFSDLQSLCRSIRGSYSSRCPSLYQRDMDSSSFKTCLSDAGLSSAREHLPSQKNKEDWREYSPLGDDADEDGCAEWFDSEMMGWDMDDGQHGPHSRFDWPVPMEAVFSPSLLPLVEYGPNRERFYTDDEGFVQVYTQGECRQFLVEKGSIGVWFGPDHPKNISERVHSGRKSQEAARFRAVIEAIRTAGNAGVKKLQINTDYINIVRFMIYFIWKWENNKWMTVKGTSVRNRILIEELDYFSKLIEIKWNYVPIEDDAEGIIEADKLAQAALDDLGELGNRPTTPTPQPKPAPKHVPIRFNPY